MELWQLAIAFAATWAIEGGTEYIFGTLFNKIPKLTPYKWALMYIALVFAVGVAFYYQLDLFALIKWLVADGELQTTWVGLLLTGILMGRGSNVLHDFVTQFIPGLKPQG